MATKIKTYPTTGAKDSAAMVTNVNKVLDTLGLKQYFTSIKAPSTAWLGANAKDGKVDVVLEGAIDPKNFLGTLKCSAKAGGQSSVMGIYQIQKEKAAVISQSLKKCGLV